MVSPEDEDANQEEEPDFENIFCEAHSALAEAKARVHFIEYELERLTNEHPEIAKPPSVQDYTLADLRNEFTKGGMFETQKLREAAIDRATLHRGCTNVAIAEWIGVDYSDLRKWARNRGASLAKGQSNRADKIEKALASI